MDQEVAGLSRVLGVQPYDLRLRLSGPLPVILAWFSDAEKARNLLKGLRERGHGAVACDGDKIQPSNQMMTPRTFEFQVTSLKVNTHGQPPDIIAFSELLALVHAQIENEIQNTTTEKSRKFSVGRAIMTGGMVLTKKTSKQVSGHEGEFEQVLYVFKKSSKEPFIFRQNTLRYLGLGSEIGQSTVENFTRLVKTLRQHAPEALYDNRLLTRRRRSTVDSVSKSKPSATKNVTVERISISNTAETDLASYLIALAHLRGQL